MERRRVIKVREGPHIVDMIKNDEIDGREHHRGQAGHPRVQLIRREAVHRRVTYYNLAAGLATCEALDPDEVEVNRPDLHALAARA